MQYFSIRSVPDHPTPVTWSRFAASALPGAATR